MYGYAVAVSSSTNRKVDLSSSYRTEITFTCAADYREANSTLHSPGGIKLPTCSPINSVDFDIKGKVNWSIY